VSIRERSGVLYGGALATEPDPLDLLIMQCDHIARA
jgi:hypothetical protein